MLERAAEQMDNQTIDVPLSAQAEHLYLNYAALSVITAAHLPGVRDGLKARPALRILSSPDVHELQPARATDTSPRNARASSAT